MNPSCYMSNRQRLARILRKFLSDDIGVNETLDSIEELFAEPDHFCEEDE